MNLCTHVHLARRDRQRWNDRAPGIDDVFSIISLVFFIYSLYVHRTRLNRFMLKLSRTAKNTQRERERKVGPASRLMKMLFFRFLLFSVAKKIVMRK